MGFFSSITKPFKKAFNKVKDVVGGVVETVAPALPVVGDVVGGLLSSNSTEDANEANIALAREQMAYQKELAQNQMQWRVEDAKKAGMHPMAALGLSSMSYSPVSSNVMPTDYSYLGDMGQNINRAVMQGKTAKERQQALDRQDQFDRIALRKANADADYAETLAASERLKLQRELFPPAPAVDGDNTLIGGQGGSVKVVPDEVIASGPSGSVTAGTHPLWTHGRSGDFVVPVLSDKLADAVTENKEKNIGAEIAYALSAWNGSVKPPQNAFTKKERALLASGDYEAYYYPLLGWRVEPRLSWPNFVKFVLGGFKKK